MTCRTVIAVSFVVAYAPTDTPQSREERDMFWTELDSIIHPVPLKHHLFILMDANARLEYEQVRKNVKLWEHTAGTYDEPTTATVSL